MLNIKWLRSLMTGHWLRKTIGIISIAAASGMLTWSIGFITTSQAQNKLFAEEMLGKCDFWITIATPEAPKTGHGAGFQSNDNSRRRMKISPDFINILDNYKSLTKIYEISAVQGALDYKPGGKPIRGPKPRVSITAYSENLYDFLFENCTLEGRLPNETSETPEAIISSAVLRRNMQAPQIGETISVLGRNGSHKVTITGIIYQKKAARGFPSMLANQACISKFIPKANNGGQLVLCKTSNYDEVKTLQNNITSVIEKEYNSKYTLITKDDKLKEMNQSLWTQFAKTAPLTIGLSLTVGICMIFAVLYISIQQRIKLYCIFRSLGTTRKQLISAILLEALIIGIIGTIIGIIIGYIALSILVSQSKELYPFGIVIDGYVYACVIIAGITTTLLGSIIPAVKVFKIRPLDYLIPEVISIKNFPVKKISIGVACLIPALTLALPIPISVALRGNLMIAIGLPLLLIGLLLCAPLWVIIMEKLAVPIIAKILNIKSCLIAYQLSRNMTKTVGAMITLTTGLGLYIAIQVWGVSMLAPFMPDDAFPDAIVSFLPMGTSKENAQKIINAEGVNSKRAMPVAADQFILSDTTLDRLRSNPRYDLWQNNILLVGLTPEIAFKKPEPFCDFQFTSGNLENNKEKFGNQTDSCIITKTFAKHGMFKIGDTLSMIIPGQTDLLELKITGIVNLNWHMITSRAGMRSQNGKPHRTLGPIFVNQKLAQTIINKKNEVKFIWFDFDEKLQTIPYQEAGKQLTQQFNKIAMTDGLQIKISQKDDVVVGTLDHAKSILGSIARLPFYSLIFLSLGMLNMIIATVAERKQEFQLMRAVGMTQTQLFRLLFSETILVFGAGVLLSLVFGLYTGWIFAGWSKAKMAFGGLDMCFIIPWLKISKGIAFAFLTTVIASIPAIMLVLKKKNTNKIAQ